MTEEFEKWALDNKLPIGTRLDGDGYAYIGTRIADLAWQASRKQALEEAAQMCVTMKYEGYVPPEDGAAREYYLDGAADCALAIRALQQ